MTTTKSLDAKHTYLEPAASAAYVRRTVVSACHRRGADGAEAGVIAEMERLLEHHVQNLFASARDYAQLAGRAMPNALDVVQAHARSSHSIKQLIAALRLELRTPPPEDEIRQTITTLAEAIEEGQDELGLANEEVMSKKLEYAFDGAPKLPPPWTYPSPFKPADSAPPAKVTSAALNFVKATVADADIDPELGIVDYRKSARA